MMPWLISVTFVIFTISLIQGRNPTKKKTADMFCWLLLVHSGVSKNYNHAFEVLFCIARPLHCVLGQQRGLIWDVRGTQPPAHLGQKKFGAPINEIAYHTQTSFSFCAVFCYDVRCRAALAFLVLWGHEKEPFGLISRRVPLLIAGGAGVAAPRSFTAHIQIRR